MRRILRFSSLAMPLLWAFAALAQRDGVADALAGHAAEMRQFGAAADPLRRPLFFDPVEIEGPDAGVPCDHLAARRPEVVAGAGWVVLMETGGSPPAQRLRFWLPPGQATEAAPEAEALAFARKRTGLASIRILASRKFLWCR